LSLEAFDAVDEVRFGGFGFVSGGGNPEFLVVEIWKMTIEKQSPSHTLQKRAEAGEFTNAVRPVPLTKNFPSARADMGWDACLETL